MADGVGSIEQLTAQVTLLNQNFAKFFEMTAAGKADGAAAGRRAGATGNGAAQPKASPVTLAEVKVIAQQIVDHPALGKAKAIELILAHGSKNLAGLDAAKYPAFIAAAQVLLQTASATAAQAEEDPLDTGASAGPGDGL